MKKKTSIKIYNSITRKKEVFKPLVEGKVGMYVCGPTVYGEPHLGHARAAITFDVVFRYLSWLGYKVRYVRNITDVGHLEDEVNGAGEDKISKKARLEQLEPMEVAQHYTNLYRDLLKELNILSPSIEPLASGHIPEQIEIIQKTIENGLAYEANGSVYFDVEAYSKQYAYGELSGRVLEELLNGSRSLEGQEEKKHPADFALWKKADKQHLMQWHSPWSKGFPGWHIECTAMSSKYLGLPFDIHGGGMDLKFPHHEAEIAQSFGAFGCAPVNYWMHNNMMTLDGQKMAKSLGNFISLKQLFSGDHFLLEKAYSPMAVRFLMLQAHYRSSIDFSNQALQAADIACKKLQTGLALLKTLPVAEKGSPELEQQIVALCESCYDKMNDDFNTAQTIACLFELLSHMHKLKTSDKKTGITIGSETAALLKKTYEGFLCEILGIPKEGTVHNSNLDKAMAVLLEIRQQARVEKNYALSDRIRDLLTREGIEIKDGVEKDHIISTI